MAARIRSLRNFITPIDEASRDDLVVTDVVTVQSLDAATTYAWSLVFVPEGSAATFSGDPLAVSPGSFTVDLVGSYLVRLIVDASLVSEDTQYVRLRAITTSLGLKLVAAGERRDESGIIPVDADPEGWANDQNANLQAIEAAFGAVDLQFAYDNGNLILLTNGATPITVQAGAAPSAQLLSFLKLSGAALGLLSHPSADQFRLAAADGVGAGNGNTLGLFAGSAVGGAGAGGSLVLRPGAGFGGGAAGEAILQNAAGTFQVGLFVSAADTLQVRTPGGGGLPLVYNTTTGKLDVPGLIDPTGIVFTEAAAPTTGASEGAIFVSDGSSGLTLGHLYFRAPSNGASTDLTTGGGGGGFVPPDEFWVDPNEPTGTYGTIAQALAAVVNPGSILHLHGGQTYLWDAAAVTALDDLSVPATGSITVITAPLAVGDVVLGLTGVAGARTSGALDFDVSLGTPTLLAAEIAAAINDPANGLDVNYTGIAAGATVNLTAAFPGVLGNNMVIDGSIFTTPPGGITGSGPFFTGGADGGPLTFLSYNGVASLASDVGGDFITDAVLNFDGLDLFLFGVNFGCVATFRNCSGTFGNQDNDVVSLTATPAGGAPSLTFNECNFTDSAFACGLGADGALMTWNRCTVGTTVGGNFALDESEVNTFWVFNDCLFNPTVAGGVAIFSTTQTDAEQSVLSVVFNDCLITVVGTDDVVPAALGTTALISYNDTRIINNAQTSTIQLDGNSEGLGSSILKVGDAGVNNFPIPYLPLDSRAFTSAFTASYGYAVYDGDATTTGGAWFLPGHILPMRTITSVATPSVALISILDGNVVVPSNGSAFLMHIRGDIQVVRTSPFGGGAHFVVDVTLTIFAGTYTVVAGGVAAADYDTSAGQYTVTINSGTDGVEFLCGQGTYGNDSQWDATLQVV